MVQHARMRRRRSLVRASIALAMLLGGFVATALPANAATSDPPTGLTVTTTGGSPIPVLTWDRSPDATSYQVQISTSPSWATIQVNTITANTHYAPTSPLPPGPLYWQVRAKYATVYSDYSQSSFTAPAPQPPHLLTPTNNTATTDYATDPNALVSPETPLVLRWEPVQGANKYDIQIAADPTFTTVMSIQSTQTTQLATPTKLLTNGRYFWRVQAEWSSSIVSGYSDPYSFTLNSHADLAATPVAPVTTDGSEPQVTDVALAWHPVPGATMYTLQVSTDRQFLDSTANVATIARITGTRYSPPATWNNDQYYWRVQGFDASNNPLGWSTTWQFQRRWSDGFGSTYPVDGAVITDRAAMFLQWHAVPHASSYTVRISPTVDFSTGVKTCVTPNITLTFGIPGVSPCTIQMTPSKTYYPAYYWAVSATDATPSGAAGPVTELAVQPTHFFNVQAPPPTAGTGSNSVLSGVSAALTGTGLTDSTSADRCDPMVLPAGCQNLPSTPVLTWPDQPGAIGYRVDVYHDQAMTNPYPNYSGYAQNPIWTPPTQFADSQAGQAYFVHVATCTSNPCGTMTDITSANIGFNIASDAVELCGVTTDHTGPVPLNDPTFAPPQPCQSSEVNTASPDGLTLTSDDNLTFSWTDYLLTTLDNAPAATVTSGPGTEARYYHVQVSTNPTFASGILDDVKVDQTTFTSTANTYPDGPIYWRVQAYDGSGNPLAWSATASLTKASAPPEPLAPTGGAATSTAPSLTWLASDNTKSYTVELYADDGNPIGSSNRVLTQSTLQTAWTPSSPLIPGKAYLWRVARIDSVGRMSPWSALQSFTVTPTSIDIISPTSGAELSPTTYAFDWKPVQGAVSYLFTLTSRTGATSTQTTQALAWAPTTMPANNTSWTWCVTPLDANGKAMTVCPAVLPSFDYVSSPTAPTLNVSGVPAVGSTLTAAVPAWNLSGVTTTYQWYLGSVTPSNAIVGATTTTYRPITTDLGNRLLVVATGTKTGYDAGTIANAGVTVGAGAAPTPSSPPRITGTPAAGRLLTVKPGTWLNSPTTFAYRWTRDSVSIPQATGVSYTPSTNDIGHTVGVTVTASRPGYASGTASRSLRIVRTPSRVATSLSAATIRTIKRASLRITVTAPPVTVITGRLAILIDGVVKLRTTVPSFGPRSVLLPRLAVGRHRVQVRYLGNSQAAPATSVVRTLTVIR